MIPLKCIVEYAVLQGQSYDLGMDFAQFKRTLDGHDEAIKRKFEKDISNKLSGKRVRARASRGYKQFEKDYEFDVSRVTIDDYYDNYVVVAHDESNPKKPKEYFLRPGFKVQIVGLASGNPTQTSDGEHRKTPKVLASPEAEPPKSQSTVPVKEAGSNYDAYSIESILDDLRKWWPDINKDRLRGFIKGLGWIKNLGKGKSMAMFDLKVPGKEGEVNQNEIAQRLARASTSNGTITTKYEINKVDFDKLKGEYLIRIKKTMTDTTAL